MTWKVLTGTNSYPAEESQIAALLSGLKDVQVEDEISDRADRASDYEVNVESVTRIQFLTRKGPILAKVSSASRRLTTPTYTSGIRIGRMSTSREVYFEGNWATSRSILGEAAN